MPEAKPPRILVTMGDPAGVGAEVAAGVWDDERLHAAGQIAVVGDPEVFRRAVALRKTNARVVPFDSCEQPLFDTASPNTMPCLRSPGPPERIAFEAIRQAAGLAKAGQIDAMVTGPISKAALQAAGYNYPGHTELLADLCGVKAFAMMLHLPRTVLAQCPYGLSVVHVTLHTSLRSVFDQLSEGAIVEKCRLADRAVRAFGAEQPRVGVAALNPHAGEEGLFGDEESRIIRPAVAIARSEGIHASGPHPVDTLMVRASHGEFDAVVAMYHDQGHIALKLLGMHQAVNVTLGLPIVRTSVAHGTAPDIAWQGVAETSGLLAATETAAHLCRVAPAPR
ncbi:MAG: 4-hydroxythreonine-4-phosphate dehydrogenase PdxA [Planctomycetales bacterium]|nr:4-hydroxythreonine-4-phosphate dehydrogenase PdxA [Planctomycetales bacterium]